MNRVKFFATVRAFLLAHTHAPIGGARSALRHLKIGEFDFALDYRFDADGRVMVGKEADFIAQESVTGSNGDWNEDACREAALALNQEHERRKGMDHGRAVASQEVMC